MSATKSVRNLQPDKIAGQIPALFDDVVGLARLHPWEHICDAEGVDDRNESLSAVVYIKIIRDAEGVDDRNESLSAVVYIKIYALRLLLRHYATTSTISTMYVIIACRMN